MADSKRVEAPAAEPILTSLPSGASTRAAASAGRPHTGSMTRCRGPSHAAAIRLLISSTSPPERSTAASAPRESARARPSSSREAAITHLAPSSLAACTATCPTAPLAPRTSTCSPGWRRPRQVSAIQAAIADSPSAAARSLSISAGRAQQIQLADGGRQDSHQRLSFPALRDGPLEILGWSGVLAEYCRLHLGAHHGVLLFTASFAIAVRICS